MDDIACVGVEQRFVEQELEDPPELISQLTLCDVKLGEFKWSQNETDRLMSGESIDVDRYGCFANEKYILRFSDSFLEVVNALYKLGYTHKAAFVRNVVFWKGKDEGSEVKIILPEILFDKK